MPDIDPQVLQNPVRMETLRRLCLIDKTVDPAFNRLTRLAARLCNAPIALVTFIDVDRQVFKSHIGLPEPYATLQETPISHSFCQHVMATGTPLVVEDAHDHPLVCDNPAIRDLNVISYLGMPLKLSCGITLGSFCVIDHTPRVWTNDEIEMLRELSGSVISEIELRAEMMERADAEKKNAQLVLERERTRMLNEFITHTSHDLRTPLSIMNSSLDLLDRIKEPEKQQRYIHNVRTQIDYLNHLVEELHSFIRLQQIGESPVEPLNINALVEKVCAGDPRIELNLAPDLPGIAGNNFQLQQAVSAILDNALHFARQQVRVSTRQRGDQVIIEVGDDGDGISDGDLPHIFEPFYRGDKARTVNGGGLGLTLSKRIVELHHGSIEVESSAGQGSLFRVVLLINPGNGK